MTNLGSIFKSRDITLPTKFRLVKAMVFPVVMYGCESWTVKKAECRRIDAFELWCWVWNCNLVIVLTIVFVVYHFLYAKNVKTKETQMVRILFTNVINK